MAVSPSDHVLNSVLGKTFLKRADVESLFAAYDRGAWNDFAHVSGVVAVNAYYNQVSQTAVRKRMPPSNVPLKNLFNRFFSYSFY